jgi:hypothetical protein
MRNGPGDGEYMVWGILINPAIVSLRDHSFDKTHHYWYSMKMKEGDFAIGVLVGPEKQG